MLKGQFECQGSLVGWENREKKQLPMFYSMSHPVSFHPWWIIEITFFTFTTLTNPESVVLLVTGGLVEGVGGRSVLLDVELVWDVVSD